MMQQTQTYKLNKPETTDVFTPAPLNENADKLDAALAQNAAAAAENCLFKLAEAALTEEGTLTLEIPDGIDLSRYGALILHYQLVDIGGGLNINGQSAATLVDYASKRRNGIGFGWFSPADGKVHLHTMTCVWDGGGGATSRECFNAKLLPWEEIKTFTFSTSDAGSRATLYGLKL